MGNQPQRTQRNAEENLSVRPSGSPDLPNGATRKVQSVAPSIVSSGGASYRSATAEGRRMQAEVGKPARKLNLSTLFADRPIALQPQDRAGERRQPRLMKSSTSHLRATRIIAAGPLKEIDVRLVPLAARCDRLATITLDLT